VKADNSDQLVFTWGHLNLSKFKKKPDWIDQETWDFVKHVKSLIDEKKLQAPGIHGRAYAFDRRDLTYIGTVNRNGSTQKQKTTSFKETYVPTGRPRGRPKRENDA
jgi:hypothetical protein